MAEIKYSDLENVDQYHELPAVLLLLDGVLANLRCIISTRSIQQSGKNQTIAGVIALLDNVHFELENLPIVPF